MKRIGILIALCIGCFFSTVQVWAAEAEYRIDVNITQNIVTVYRQGAGGVYTAERAFYCSTGAATPTGTYKTTNKYEWRALFGNVYGQYATRITGHILFHSVPYRTMAKDSLDTQAYNKLGTSASMGCIRLTVEDAKWIYDNCPSGTTVRMYKSDERSRLYRKRRLYWIQVIVEVDGIPQTLTKTIRGERKLRKRV